jgi:hypothetical protein
MSQMGLEPTIPVFERANTIYALDRATTVIGLVILSSTLYSLDISSVDK